ncbi:NifU family protein [Ichthyenterobacterium sp. W332]|uniref:NifU family protein n=1 Tax=Microcosmobacter mediterraneus TaxID=3075607 RepID=A0ABU2YI36_9FLAO|nr:NifU family protein [Ichthyenterobacterium sp. W332]MDT0557697.1 NifU family protein [Ichthyenterobacterium sp. W332]
MNSISLDIKPTSNDAIIKFEASEFITQHHSYEFKNIDDAKVSPLAQELFHLPFVKTVYISGNFIAVERYNIIEWSDVEQDVAEQIKNYINSGKPIITEEPKAKKTPVTIYAESTPNPSVLKFVANKKLVVLAQEFKSIDDTEDSPFAKELFHFPFVKSVYIDENFVSITKYDMADWNDITMELREFIRAYIENSKPIVTSSKTAHKKQTTSVIENNKPLDDTSKEIVSILNEYVKPAVASDGGNIEFESFDESSKTVKVILQGACSGCPSSTYTLKNGIETMLREMMKGKVEFVEAING